jgi:alanine racemase
MHRVGCTTDDAFALARRIVANKGLILEGIFTHFATADEADPEFVNTQLERFTLVLDELERAGINPPLKHCANSAAALTRADTRLNMVRLGITIYGIAPSPEQEPLIGLTQALRLTSEVTFVKRLSAGDRLSYGQRYELMADSTIVTIPVGYADGVPRRLGEVGGEVLIVGARFPISGTVTMDQLLVDVGDAQVSIGDEVVFLGKQGSEEITASEWAGRLNTIAYEIVCGIGPRVPREYRE